MEQAVLALPGSWAACHVVDIASGASVGMERLIGDGGSYWQTLPDDVCMRVGRFGGSLGARAGCAVTEPPVASRAALLRGRERHLSGATHGVRAAVDHR